MQFTLLVLAAGMGSRYGGLKQLEPVGPNGETLLDYSVFDAVRAGFGKIVFVIRRDFADVFRAQIGAKYAGRVAVDYVFQALDDLPAGFAAPTERQKPWGTGHATWCARAAVAEPFAVINADDFYGADSFRQLAKFLAGAQANEAAMVGFRLERTLSENGAVSRGICEVGEGGWLARVTERTGIVASDLGAALRPDALTSMNCWGFRPEIFPRLEQEFRAFLAGLTTPTSGEFYLPAAVSTLIEKKQLKVRVLPTESDWFGVTYREDRPKVIEALAARVKSGGYPAKLF